MMCKKFKSLMAGLILLVCGLPLSAQEVDSTAYSRQQLAQAAALKNAGNIEESFQLLELLIQQQPGNHEAYFEIAMIAIEAGDLNFAHSSLEQALSYEKDEARYWDIWLQLNQHQGDAQTSLDALDELIRLKPEEEKYYFDRAFALFYLDRPDEALEEYASIRERFGASEALASALAEQYLETEQKDKAIEVLQEWIATNPENPGAHIFLSDIYRRDKRQAEALQLLEQFEAKQPENPFVQLAKVDIFLQRKQHRAVMGALKKAYSSPALEYERKVSILYTLVSRLEKSQFEEILAHFVDAHADNFQSHAVSGELLAQTGDFHAARDAYNKALTLNPDIPRVWTQLVHLNIELNDLAKAREVGVKAVSLFPEAPGLQASVGSVFLIERDYEQARPYFEAALDQVGETDTTGLTLIYGVLGDLYHYLDMSAASDVAYQEVLALDPDNLGALNNYAYFLAERDEELEKAEKMASRVVALSPNTSTYEDTYAWVLFKQGKYDQALTWIRRALKNDTGRSAVLLEHYGDILYMNGQLRQAVTQWKKSRSALDPSDDRLPILERKINERTLVD